jgi:hypothetical protein
MKYKQYTKLCSDPLEIEAIVHCGQVRRVKGEKDEITRIYRIEPDHKGLLFVVRDQKEKTWHTEQTFGDDLNGVPLIGTHDLDAAISSTRSWVEMEVALATYFQCCVYQFHRRSAGQKRLTARPLGSRKA